ncbi:hypothetical protein BDV96DRAFT_687027 [Lophiotrema nucula]|uniref:RRM domain-containing protein n=1 Tax=Lophiotrema nucula TaxID=690887 RepID=A0A6A5Z8T3_9PLEO|nr:hypothetical protein BDV96DRAFT_687027 [Lophiotrema nucula]
MAGGAIVQTAGLGHAHAPTAEDEATLVQLTKNVKEEHLREIFGKYGAIRDIKVPLHPIFQVNRGTAYILYEEINDADNAVAKMHEAQLDGTKISYEAEDEVAVAAEEEAEISTMTVHHTWAARQANTDLRPWEAQEGVSDRPHAIVRVHQAALEEEEAEVAAV